MRFRRKPLSRGLAALGALGALLWLSLAPANPELFPGSARRVVVVDHGYHAGLMLRPGDLRAAAVALGRDRPQAARRLRALAARWPGARWLEVGWGDRAFYQAVARLGDFRWDLALPAVLWPTPSVLQAVPVWSTPEAAFPAGDRVALGLSEPGFVRLAAALAATLPPGERLPPAIGPSLYGPGRFYPAAPSYHGLRTCNQWVSALLRAAGVPTSWFWSVTSAGLVAELRLRTDLGYI